MPPDHEAFVTEEVGRLLATSAITSVAERPVICLPLGVVPKKKNKLRLIHDLRRLNVQLRQPAAFKMEDLSVVAPQLEEGDEMMTLDLDQAYHHVEIHPAHRKYLGFQWRGQYYVWNVLPFGLNQSPLVFTKVLRPVVAYLRQRGARVNLYLDDWLILVKRRQHAAAILLEVLTLLRDLGLHVNFEKSSLTPAHTALYLGMEISTLGRPQFRVPQEKLHKIRHELSRALRAETVSYQTLARLAGLCASVLRAVLPGRMFLRNVYRQLKSMSRSRYTAQMPLTTGARSDLEWWISALRQWNGALAMPLPTDSVLTTDASSTGWGATFLDLKARGDWTPELASAHTNVRELTAVLLSLRAFRTQLQGRSVLLRSDNVTTVASINRLVGKSPRLNAVVYKIFQFCTQHRISLRALWIPGNDNTTADELSRRPDPNDWELSGTAFTMIDLLFGPHSIDRMASATNSKLPRFNSRLYDPAAEAVNCFAQEWAGENNYVAPPLALIPAVLRHVISCKAEATIIAPIWPSAWWWGLLLRLSTSLPLPLLPGHFRCGPSGRLGPLKNPRWRFAAFRVAGSRIAGSRH